MHRILMPNGKKFAKISNANLKYSIPVYRSQLSQRC